MLSLLEELRDSHGMCILLVTNDEQTAAHADRRSISATGVIRAVNQASSESR